MSPIFSLPRFTRVLQNDALRMAKPLGIGTLALLGITVLNYLANFEPGHTPNNPPMSAILFGVYLIGTGLLMTSLSFHDMHHPLERYQYLLLPISNPERFLSRYLLTGPLLILYFAVAFAVMDWTGNELAELWRGASEPLFAPFSDRVLLIARTYLLLHIIAFTGAICFRSYALIKTALSVLLLMVSMGVAFYLSLRIFYFDVFSWTTLAGVKPLRMLLEPAFVADWMNTAVVIGFALWILYVAYRCLRAHEVQNGL
jgi:hypothetical protein